MAGMSVRVMNNVSELSAGGEGENWKMKCDMNEMKIKPSCYMLHLERWITDIKIEIDSAYSIKSIFCPFRLARSVQKKSMNRLRDPAS